jgi:hypothetical protein
LVKLWYNSITKKNKGKKMRTLSDFFRVYKNELPYRYDTFFKYYKTDEFMQEMKKKGILYIGGSEKRRTYKVIDDEKFKEFLFNLEMGAEK